MGIISEEIGRYDPYTDKFIKNTTTDRIEVGTDGNLYRLSVSNCNEFLSKDKLYTKADMVAMLEKLKTEIEKLKSYESADGQDLVMLADIGILFQQKIDKLKETMG